MIDIKVLSKKKDNASSISGGGCDLLKIHYLCGDKDNINSVFV